MVATGVLVCLGLRCSAYAQLFRRTNISLQSVELNGNFNCTIDFLIKMMSLASSI